MNIIQLIKNLDLSTKISALVLLVTLVISATLIFNKPKTTNTSVTTSNTKDFIEAEIITETPIVESNIEPINTVSLTPIINPKNTPEVSSLIITPTIIPTSIPTLTSTPSPTNTPVPTKIPTVRPTLVSASGVSLSATSVNLYIGERQQVTAKVEPDNTYNQDITWTYNGDIISIEPSGLITAKKQGNTTVIVKTTNGKFNLIDVVVNSNITPTSTPVPTTMPIVTTPTNIPTQTPTKQPTQIPTKNPTLIPTNTPTPVFSYQGCVDTIKTTLSGTFFAETLDGMKYVLYLPPNYTDSKKWPLLVFMHGWGEHGTDLNLLYNSGTIPRIFRDGNNYNTIMIAPQNSGSWSTVSKQNTVMSIINNISTKYSVDKSRISLTGHSDACRGIWPMVRSNPNYFSAVVPIASSYPSSNSSSGLTNTNIWYFYGTRDVSTTNRTTLINAIKNDGGKAQITAISGSHNITKQVYLDQKMIEWMLCQTR